jgi:hypothetical protein
MSLQKFNYVRRYCKDKGIEWKFCERADNEHAADKRQYAHTYHHAKTICVARAFDDLPVQHQDGIVLHEIGHLLAGKRATEQDADIAIRKLTGIRIYYIDSRYGNQLETVSRQVSSMISQGMVNSGNAEE